MASRKIFMRNVRGFTLIEILLAVGILSLLASVALYADFSAYRGDAFRGERATIVSLMQKARADALNNIDQEPHGLALFPADHPHSYVLFEGTSYAANPQTYDVVDAGYPIVLNIGSPQEIVFSQLTADASYTGSIGLVDTERGVIASVDINQEGMISW